MRRNGKAMHQPKPVPTHWQDELDWAYSETIYPTLARRYPNRWVAIAHHRVVASGIAMMKVHTAAQRKTGRKEVPLVFVERGIHVYLTHGPRA